ncbi:MULTISPECIES: hypothetical protein [Natronospira]|uniref:Uncharacterized protein n=2 Tax=Natronospira TaxID=2024969 RepID=A0AAP6MND2_9GAMM|nr:hypothetical protein [Natronospira sp. AB-CW4]MDQ2068642.1 hypothetical protein [Natronospira sp. AB-CW4]MEA5446471.1 hypothetical protein [Gammaproteobacteria bacterium AB-CW1]
MKSQVCICVLASVMSFGAWAVDDRADPWERDEDISGVVVDVEYSRRDDGFYQYDYVISNPEDSKGIVSTLFVDLECDQELDDQGLQEQRDDDPRNMGIGRPEEHGIAYTPAIIRADRGDYGISVLAEALWGVYIKPGETWGNMRIISPYGPGMRQFKVDPALNTDPRYWNYDDVAPEEMEELPGKEDFRVTGVIIGPECPGVTPPPDSARFY